MTQPPPPPAGPVAEPGNTPAAGPFDPYHASRQPEATGGWPAPPAPPHPVYPGASYPEPGYPVYPGAHYPAPAYPTGHQPPGVPQPRPPVNGAAVASLVLALLTLLPFSVATGIIALVQIGRNGQRGKGLAIAGLSISGVLFLSFAVAGAVSGLARVDDAPAQEQEARPFYSSGFVPGHCLKTVDEDTSLEWPPVKCTEPHQGEVFAVFDMSGADYPGDDAVWRYATAGCDERLPSYAPSADLDEEYMIYFPTAETWRDGDRWIVCVAYHEAPRTGSIRD